MSTLTIQDYDTEAPVVSDHSVDKSEVDYDRLDDVISSWFIRRERFKAAQLLTMQKKK